MTIFLAKLNFGQNGQLSTAQIVDKILWVW